jgi:hypothetical protein
VLCRDCHVRCGPVGRHTDLPLLFVFLAVCGSPDGAQHVHVHMRVYVCVRVRVRVRVRVCVSVCVCNRGSGSGGGKLLTFASAAPHASSTASPSSPSLLLCWWWSSQVSMRSKHSLHTHGRRVAAGGNRGGATAVPVSTTAAGGWLGSVLVVRGVEAHMVAPLWRGGVKETASLTAA